ncbi:aminotransferase class V-fold PLP-dependent enzyme [Mycoplasma suis]|uniref:Selenocysteine lyase/cysteine desulfurase n=1 Tax=Mycoplasma suis (strain Illinois) TaxID=768700 RepID=F0QS87_MYCSL|nr:aminotransferase class V-fold PLP-dependent enzyme [Mycoplasma suis]ADX98357.1 selenocysteine lyase/cysteine desulfurase [Mycoplasma suis str. Illinois]
MIYFDNAATSQKFPFFWEEWLKSYIDSSWIHKKHLHKQSLLDKLSKYLGFKSQNIFLTPSSTYAINEIWEYLFQEKKDVLSIYLFSRDHISNIASVIYKYQLNSEAIRIHFLEHNKENYVLLPNSIILLTVKDNLGVFHIKEEIIRRIREDNPSSFIIGDFNQYMSNSSEAEKIFSLFDCIYFSAHKWFGPFGLAVIGFNRPSKLRFAEESNYSLDWRSIFVWDKVFWKIQEEINKNREKFCELRKTWIENFPKTPNLSYRSYDNSLIFLVRYKSEFFHDFIFWLEENKVIFRAGDLCSTYDDRELGFSARFSLSILNTVDEIKKFCELVKFFMLQVS